MKKMIIVMSILLAWATSLPAQTTREQADAIVWEHLKSETTHFSLHINANTPNEEGFSMTTLGGETVKAKYACWVYFVGFDVACYACVLCPCPHHYLFIKEDNGSVLEVIANSGLSDDNPWSWQLVDPSGITEPKDNNKSLYPNPVDDWLTIPCKGENTAVEIYDLKGTRLFSKELADKDACRLNVSFLSAGIYMLNVSGETYKMIKN